MSFLVSKWKDSNNEILLKMKYEGYKVNTNYLKDKRNDEYYLDRKDFYHFSNMVCYVPMKILLQLGLEDIVEDICNEMQEHLSKKRKSWSNTTLFQNFTHVLNRHKWWNDKGFQNKSLLDKYDSLCRKWYKMYGAPVMKQFEKLTLSKLKKITVPFKNKLDFTLQFMKLLDLELSEKAKSLIHAMIGQNHTKQTEHIYMLSVMME